jgi:ABC-type transport system involved in multi-copper enzyme maturation permease subunit|tara:strand:- start:82 stop:891 length:810 start_codon:yes stop_codon:yes gene_type:complete
MLKNKMGFKKFSKQTMTICFHEFNQSLKDWKVLLILILLLATLIGSLFLIDDVQERLNDASKKQNYRAHKDINVYDLIGREFGNPNFFVPFFVLAIILPLAIAFMFFDSVSSERQYNSIRYLITRVSHESIIFGKFLSNLFIIAPTILLFYIIAMFHIHYKLLEPLNFASVFYPWFFFSFYSAAIISFILFLSTFPKKPIRAIGLGIVGLLLMALFISNEKLKWLSVFYYLKDSVIGSLEQQFFNIMMLVIFSAVFLILGIIKLRRSDL